MNFKDYIKGNRHGKDANRFEQEAQNDPFLMEAIDGFDEHPYEMHLSVIEQLEKNITAKAKAEVKTNKYWYVGIAASFALLLGISVLLWQQKPDEIILAEKIDLPSKTVKDTVNENIIIAQNIENKPIAQQIEKEKKVISQPEKFAPAEEEEIAYAANLFISENKQIDLEEDLQVIDEIVVPTLQVADKKILIGATINVDTDVSDALQGRAAGVDVQRNVSGTFGSASKIRIRGTNSNTAKAQTIRGKVIDEHGEPLIGATIKLSGSNIGTVSDMNGNFMLTVDNAENAIIQVNYIGYNTQTVAVNRDLIIVRMNENLLALSEMVVAGYATQKKAELTGTVSAINAEKTAKPEFDKEKFLIYFAENKQDIQCTEENPILKAEFFIDENGKPNKIKITECNCKKLESEFRRLLKKTANWTNVNEKISIEIRD